MASRGQHHKRIYALYKGDTNLCDGTIKELAQQLGVAVTTMKFYASPTYQHRNLKPGHEAVNRIIVIPIGWDDDDEN
jgi:C1A family cysteine protease